MEDLLMRLSRLRWEFARREPIDVVLDGAMAARRQIELALRRLRGEPDREFVRNVMSGVLDVWLATDAPALERLRRDADDAGIAIDRGVHEGAADITRLLSAGGAEGDRMVDLLAKVLMAVPHQDRAPESHHRGRADLDQAFSRAYGMAEATRAALVREATDMLGRPHSSGLPGLILCGPAGSWKQRAARHVAGALTTAETLDRPYLFEIPALRFLESEGIASVVLGLSAGGGLLIRDLHPLAEGHHPWETELDAVVARLRQAYERPSVFGRRLLVVAARTEREATRFMALHRDLPMLFRPPIFFEMPDDEALARVALPRWSKFDPEIHEAMQEAMGLLRALPAFAGHHSASEFARRVTSGVGNVGMTPERIRAVATELAPPPDPAAADRILADIEAMVGLGKVVSELRAVVAAARANAARRRAGLPVVGPPPHLLLLGEPGTGKTTVARLIGPLLHAAGALARPDVVEVGRTELVGEYIGQTAPLVTAAFDRARGGVLFVDEAYALDAHSEMDFGHEVLATLVALMENNRAGTVVILAGYTEPTMAMVEMNPGLASRIGRTIAFPDLSITELVMVFARLAQKSRMELDETAVEAVSNVIAAGGRAGGGRMVRNLFERACEHHALRCAEDGLDGLVEPLRLADIPSGEHTTANERAEGGYL